MTPAHNTPIDPADLSLPPTEPIDITALTNDWLEKEY